MELLNALSRARALALFTLKWFEADCLATDALGDCVYITGDAVGDRYQVTKADPTDYSKMPAVGVIVSKVSATQCRVQFIGELVDIYSGLTVRKTAFVGLDGRIAESPPIPAPVGYAFSQTLGTVIDSGRILLTPNFHMIKQVG
jgi:hypothetical protein